MRVLASDSEIDGGAVTRSDAGRMRVSTVLSRPVALGVEVVGGDQAEERARASCRRR